MGKRRSRDRQGSNSYRKGVDASLEINTAPPATTPGKVPMVAGPLVSASNRAVSLPRQARSFRFRISNPSARSNRAVALRFINSTLPLQSKSTIPAAISSKASATSNFLHRYLPNPTLQVRSALRKCGKMTANASAVSLQGDLPFQL